MSQKIIDAESMCTDRNDPRYYRGISILTSICMNSLIDTKTRIQSFRKLLSINTQSASDTVTRIRDSVPHLEEKSQIKTIELICELAKLSNLDPYERITCAISIFNNRYIEYCYPVFEFLLYDPTLLINYRIEAARFLIYSDVEKLVKAVTEVLTTIIGDTSYPSDYRYKIIAGFITTTGISTFFNLTKLNIVYNEELCYKLQRIFFFNDNNGIRERILSGQHLLQITKTTLDERRNVIQKLISVADDRTVGEDVRADASDVVMRLGEKEDVDTAKRIVAELGTTVYDEEGNRIRKAITVYDNSQNVHTSSIQDSVDGFIIDLINGAESRGVENYANIHSQVTEHVYKHDISPEQRLKAFKAIDRISIDTALFTKYRVSSAELLVHIWHRILRFEDKDVQSTLKSRLVDELVDMYDTCSSGHSARLCNVLSGYGFDLQISFGEQIIANVKARINARIKLLSEEEQVTIAMGVLSTADRNDRDAYTEFIERVREPLYDELKKEFVEAGYIRLKEFTGHFDDAIKTMSH